MYSEYLSYSSEMFIVSETLLLILLTKIDGIYTFAARNDLYCNLLKCQRVLKNDAQR